MQNIYITPTQPHPPLFLSRLVEGFTGRLEELTKQGEGACWLAAAASPDRSANTVAWPGKGA